MLLCITNEAVYVNQPDPNGIVSIQARAIASSGEVKVPAIYNPYGGSKAIEGLLSIGDSGEYVLHHPTEPPFTIRRLLGDVTLEDARVIDGELSDYLSFTVSYYFEGAQYTVQNIDYVTACLLASNINDFATRLKQMDKTYYLLTRIQPNGQLYLYRGLAPRLAVEEVNGEDERDWTYQNDDGAVAVFDTADSVEAPSPLRTLKATLWDLSRL